KDWKYKIQDRERREHNSRPGTRLRRRFKTGNEGNEVSRPETRPERRFKTGNTRFKTGKDGNIDSRLGTRLETMGMMIQDRGQDQERRERRFKTGMKPGMKIQDQNEARNEGEY